MTILITNLNEFVSENIERYLIKKSFLILCVFLSVFQVFIRLNETGKTEEVNGGSTAFTLALFIISLTLS